MPVAGDLILKDIENPYIMSINAPYLRSFVFRGNPQLIYLENDPLLSNVLYEPKEFVLEEKYNFDNTFSSIIAL